MWDALFRSLGRELTPGTGVYVLWDLIMSNGQKDKISCSNVTPADIVKNLLTFQSKLSVPILTYGHEWIGTKNKVSTSEYLGMVQEKLCLDFIWKFGLTFHSASDPQ